MPVPYTWDRWKVTQDIISITGSKMHSALNEDHQGVIDANNYRVKAILVQELDLLLSLVWQERAVFSYTCTNAGCMRLISQLQLVASRIIYMYIHSPTGTNHYLHTCTYGIAENVRHGKLLPNAVAKL